MDDRRGAKPVTLIDGLFNMKSFLSGSPFRLRKRAVKIALQVSAGRCHRLNVPYLLSLTSVSNFSY
jgi:hypothetical protein